jgi:hypothetical protein
MGMSAEEFWHGDPRLAASYREAERIRRDNRSLAEWREGAYVYRAVVAALSDKEEARYPSEPMFQAGGGDGPARERAERARMENMLSRFEARAAGINAKLAGGAGEGD